MNAEKQKEDSCTFSQIKTQRRILINKQFQEESSLFFMGHYLYGCVQSSFTLSLPKPSQKKEVSLQW